MTAMAFLKNIISVIAYVALVHLTNTEVRDTKKTAVNIYTTAISDFFSMDIVSRKFVILKAIVT